MTKTKSFINGFTFQMEITSRIFYNLTREMFKEDTKNKITLDEYIILEVFVLYPHLNKDTLAIVLVRDKKYIERMLSGLLKKKLIKEVKSPNSQIKVQYYELTAAGEKLYSDNVPKNDKLIAILAKFISENELLTFTKTLLKVRNILISLGYA